ncbi:hypothetical protein OIU79_026362 [Salix purpurea]|uniref:Uncharacterized protein n=1 Tax=Salix purpurea TaxID=77065 RepID=A0A9Q0VTP7_SALPP|nr:hypothetical protein OIU79_026362 [Salix purpurea]
MVKLGSNWPHPGKEEKKQVEVVSLSAVEVASEVLVEWSLEVFVSLDFPAVEKLALEDKLGRIQILWRLASLDVVTCQRLSSNGSCKVARKQGKQARDQVWKPLLGRSASKLSGQMGFESGGEKVGTQNGLLWEVK